MSEEVPEAGDAPDTGDVPGEEEITQLLWAHADATAERIVQWLDGPVNSNNLTRFLSEEGGLRYPTELLFTEDGLSPHQFAQPVFYESEVGRRCMLHMHPRYREYREAQPYLVAYMAAVIMYGDAADSDLCEHLGAMLVGRDREGFYADVCTLADWRPVGER